MANPTWLTSPPSIGGTGTSDNLTIPAGWVAGAKAFLAVEQTGGSAITVTSSNGAAVWETNADLQAWNGTTNRLTIYERILTAADLGATVTVTFAVSQIHALAIVALDGAQGRTAISNPVIKNTASTTNTFNPVTPTVADSTIVYFNGANLSSSSGTGQTNSQPTSYTEAIDVTQTGTNNHAALSIGRRDLTGSAGSAQTVGNITVSASSRGVTLAIAVAPTVSQTVNGIVFDEYAQYLNDDSAENVVLSPVRRFPAGSVGIAVITSNADSANLTATVTDSVGNTWTLIEDQSSTGGQNGFVGAYRQAFASSTDASVTGTLSAAIGGAGVALKLYVLKSGYNTTTPIGTSAPGSSTSATITTASITPNTTGLIIAAASDWTAPATMASSDLTEDTWTIASQASGSVGFKAGTASSSTSSSWVTPDASTADTIIFEVQAGTTTLNGAADLVATTTLATTGTVTALASASLTASATLSTPGTVTKLAAADLTASASLGSLRGRNEARDCFPCRECDPERYGVENSRCERIPQCDRDAFRFLCSDRHRCCRSDRECVARGRRDRDPARDCRAHGERDARDFRGRDEARGRIPRGRFPTQCIGHRDCNRWRCGRSHRSGFAPTKRSRDPARFRRSDGIRCARSGRRCYPARVGCVRGRSDTFGRRNAHRARFRPALSECDAVRLGKRDRANVSRLDRYGHARGEWTTYNDRECCPGSRCGSERRRARDEARGGRSVRFGIVVRFRVRDGGRSRSAQRSRDLDRCRADRRAGRDRLARECRAHDGRQPDRGRGSGSLCRCQPRAGRPGVCARSGRSDRHSGSQRLGSSRRAGSGAARRGRCARARRQHAHPGVRRGRFVHDAAERQKLDASSSECQFGCHDQSSRLSSGHSEKGIIVRVPAGQPVRLDFEVEDLSGTLVTPGSVKMELLSILGINTIAAPVNDGIGLYHSILDAEIADPDHYAWKFSTTAPGKTVRSGTIDVYDPLAQEMLGLDDGKVYLNIALDNPVHDEEISGFIRTLTPAVEYLVGPVEPKTYRRKVFGSSELVLPVAPIISVTSVTPQFGGLAPIDTSLLSVDSESGTIYYTDLVTCFPRCALNVVVVAGRYIVDEAISHAAKVILAHLWETQRGRAATTTVTRRSSSDDTTVLPGFGFSIPNRAIELLKPLSLKTGLA